MLETQTPISHDDDDDDDDEYYYYYYYSGLGKTLLDGGSGFLSCTTS
jgi:hypothetical protein